MIFTDRTVIVQKGTSSINDTIVLYRGDREVEIRFTLNESSPFKFGSGVTPNIIEKTEAAYGQLVIKTPGDKAPIFSEITATKKGAITFTITAEMIDEITEVGNYTFQIRLLDENKEGRVTIPEVVNGIEVREPIATEDISDTNEVGVATVGYALTTAGTTEDTFDSQGNYNKTTWGTGDRITAAKLNKIEAGIDGVNKKVSSGGSGGEVDLSGYVTKETGNANQITFADGQTFQAKLDAGMLKGEKGERGEQGLKGDKGDSGAKPTDEQVKAAVDNYLAQNPIDGDISSITKELQGTNLFDKNNCLTSRPTDTGTASGTFSNWIPIKKGRMYSSNQANAKIWYFYNEDKTYNTWSGSAYPKYEAPCDGYLLINLNNTDVETLKVAEGTNADGAYEANTKLIKSKIPTLSRWDGKRWLCIGDSITTERGGYAEKSYASMVASNLGLQLTNIAVGGRQLTDALTWVTNLNDTDFDLVTIMMGTNDHVFQGSLSNITTNFESVIRKIQERMPNAVIAYITPIKRVFFDNKGDESNVGADGYVVNHGTSLSELVDAMKIKCRELSIPCLDIYDVLDPKLEHVRKTYFLKADGTDGTHPSVLGHAKFIAPRVNAFLESLAPFYTYINPDVSGEPSEPEVTTYTITKNLTNCTISNSTSSISQNASYSATISANSGYTLGNVTITMGGANITSTAYSNGNISISSVTGNIVITASATATQVVPTTYTITNTLTNVTNSNSATSVNENAPYTATLTADDGYTLDTPVITMGGNDITSTVYSNGNINISNVTGNIIITCSATQNSSSGNDAVLLHSWNLAGETTTDDKDQTVYADLTNNFNLIMQSNTKLGNDRFYSNGGGLLLEKTDSFTLVLSNVKSKNAYVKDLFNTGISGGMNVWGNSSVSPVTKGRFKLIKGTAYGNYDLKGEYYATEKDGTLTSMVFDKTATIDANNSHTIKVTYDATNTVGKIYLDNELVCTINDSLLIDGLYLGETEHIQFGEIKLYRGLI